MRIRYATLSADEKSHLSRTTRWRAEKRGWVTKDYHQRFVNLRVNAAPTFNAEIALIEAQRCVGYAIGQRWPCASYLDRDDLIQECVIELWRNSAKAGYASAKWRAEVMLRHLRRLRQQCRFDRDRFNREININER